MADYDLTRLGSRAFEQLVVALARRELGSGVQVFGDGPDGGREATLDGTIRWSATAHGLGNDRDDVWRGYTVLQAKFQVKPKPDPWQNAKWLKAEISRELAGWVKAASKHTRSRLPDYLIFISNVDLSPVAEIGGIDDITRFVNAWLARTETRTSGLKIKGVKVWHGDQIRSMLDANQEVRLAYPGLLTAGDVLARLDQGIVSIGSLDARDPLRDELLASLQSDRYIRLSQSGGPGGGTLWLDDIAIDLPASLDQPSDATVQAVQHVLTLGDMVLRQRQPDRIHRPNVVLVGGPGQGKSTLSQLIAQAYRAAMLTDADPPPRPRTVLQGTATALHRLGLTVPANRRWPVRIDLAKYAEELASGADTNLLRWISQQISKRIVDQIPPRSLREWLRAWPWALLLDGLDEVPTQEARRQVYGRLDDLLSMAEDDDADLLLVVTTRPTGYDERLPADRFQHLQLEHLPADQAAAFAQQLTDQRFAEDDEMRAKVAQRMREATTDPVSLRLMETPLQVTVMSFIVEKYPTLPPDRFTLFNLYYETMREREIAKDIPIARFISRHRRHIDRLHEQVGLALQVSSEEASGADASMPPDDLHDLAAGQFRLSGFDDPEALDKATALVDAATKRLVLLVPRDNGVGFDIRTLQELMAARAIAEGDDAAVMDRLRLIAHHPHWRNTWLLAVGCLLVASERFESHLLRLLRELDSDPHRLDGRYPSAPYLAADILHDGQAAQRPGFERGLLQCCLTILNQPPFDTINFGDTLHWLVDNGHRQTVYERIKAAASAGPAGRATATLALTQGTFRHVAKPPAAMSIHKSIDLDELERAAVTAWSSLRFHSSYGEVSIVPADHHAAAPTSMAELLHPTLAHFRAGLSPEDQVLLDGCQAALAHVTFNLLGAPPQTALPVANPAPAGRAVAAALASQDIAMVYELALSSLPSTQWAVDATFGAMLIPAQNRRPVGAHLRRSIAAAHAAEAADRD